MKNYKRADRRYKKWIKFKKRVENNMRYCWSRNLQKKEELRKEILLGQSYTWLKTTGSPCSCDDCSPKYKRPKKSEILKSIYKKIND